MLYWAVYSKSPKGVVSILGTFDNYALAHRFIEALQEDGCERPMWVDSPDQLATEG